MNRRILSERTQILGVRNLRSRVIHGVVKSFTYKLNWCQRLFLLENILVNVSYEHPE